jgi:transcriptional regulator with XRE-family HTH domain
VVSSMVVSQYDTLEYSYPKLPIRNEAGGLYAESMGFGDRLREARNAKELSGEELGRRLALSKASISHWENERYQPNLEQLKALCAELDVTADWLLERPGLELSADAIQEAMAYEALSPENRRKWRAMRHAIFSPSASLAR